MTERRISAASVWMLLLLMVLGLAGREAGAASTIDMSDTSIVSPVARDAAWTRLYATNGNPLYYTRTGSTNVCRAAAASVSALLYAKVPETEVSAGAVTSEGATIFNTNIPGIGVAFFVGYNTANPQIPLVDHQAVSLQTAAYRYSTQNRAYCTGTLPVTVRAVYYPTDNSGGLVNGAYSVSQTYNNLFYIQHGSGGAVVDAIHLQTNLNLTMQPHTCRLSDTTDRLIQLPPVSASQLSASGGITPAQTAAQFSFTCDSQVSQIYATLSDVQNNANNNGSHTVLSNDTGAGMATGVGISLLRGSGSTAAPLGLALPNKGNAGQWALSDYGSNTQLSLRARYVRTGAPVTPGNVRAQAAITFSYQ